MKTIIILLVTTFAAITAFAQKSKANITSTKPMAIMVQYACPMHPGIVSNKPGKCSECGMDLTLTKKEQMNQELTKAYTCPMHREVVTSHEGTCPKCSSKLVVDRQGSKQGKYVYTCSMHPQATGNKIGKCPICGKGLKKQNIKADSTKTDL